MCITPFCINAPPRVKKTGVVIIYKPLLNVNNGVHIEDEKKKRGAFLLKNEADLLK